MREIERERVRESKRVRGESDMQFLEFERWEVCECRI